MNFLADESLDAPIVSALRDAGHHVLYITETIPGAPDSLVLEHSNTNRLVLLTCDRDFGELVFRRREVHQGVVLVRLHGIPASQKANILVQVIAQHGDSLIGAFSVVSQNVVRIRKH